MSGAEVKVPKGVREFMPTWIEPTLLGDPCAAARQYRYGNLHIREYTDHYTVHVDRVDPRRDPLGHLIHDAPEALGGLAAGLAAGVLTYFELRRADKSRGLSAATATNAALAAGFFTYEGSKRLKEQMKTTGRRWQQCIGARHGGSMHVPV